MSQAQHQHISDHNDGRKYFTQIPHIADDELNLYEYRLYGHYLYVCGQNEGTCQETEQNIYQKCGMSREKFRKAHNSLIEKGYISITTIGQGTELPIVNITDLGGDQHDPR